jgi:hypothetical protein
MAKSKGSTAVQVLLPDAEKTRLDNYRRSLEDIPARGTALRELALIGLRVVTAQEADQEGDAAA